MPALSGTRSLASATLAGFAAIILAFICDLRRRTEISETLFCKYRRIARHFLIWLELTGTELKTVDGTIIDRFLQTRLSLWRTGRACPPPSVAQAPYVPRTYVLHPVPGADGAYRDARRAGGQSAVAGRVPHRFARRRLRGGNHPAVPSGVHRSHCLASSFPHPPVRPDLA